MSFSAIVNEAIALSEAAQAYWATELPKRHPDYPLVRPGEEGGPPPEEEEKLRLLLTGLSPDELYKVALLMSLGRGSCTTENLADHYESLKNARRQPEGIVTQLVETAPPGRVSVRRLGGTEKTPHRRGSLPRIGDCMNVTSLR